MGDNFPWCFDHLVEVDLRVCAYQLRVREQLYDAGYALPL